MICLESGVMLTWTLTGGVSYFSNTYGWACDNVESYDVSALQDEPLFSSPWAPNADC